MMWRGLRERSGSPEMGAFGTRKTGQDCRKLIEDRFSLPVMHAGTRESTPRSTGSKVPALLEEIG